MNILEEPHLLPPSVEEELAFERRECRSKAMKLRAGKGRYVELMRHARTTKLDRKEVFSQWASAGIPAPRASELWAVAHAPERVWKQIESGQLGFRKALALVRAGSKVKVRQATFERTLKRILKEAEALGIEGEELSNEHYKIRITRRRQ